MLGFPEIYFLEILDGSIDEISLKFPIILR